MALSKFREGPRKKFDMGLWMGGIAAFTADLTWRVFFPETAAPQFLVLWLLRESVRRDDYFVPIFAFIMGAAWDAAIGGILFHHAILWLFLFLLVRRLMTVVWFDYLASQVFIAFVASLILRGADSMIWLSRWPTNVGETRILETLISGAVLDGLCFPVIWRLFRESRRRGIFETARL